MLQKSGAKKAAKETKDGAVNGTQAQQAPAETSGQVGTEHGASRAVSNERGMLMVGQKQNKQLRARSGDLS